MSWNNVGSVQKSANYHNKHDRGRSCREEKKQVVHVKADKPPVDGRVDDVAVALHYVVLGHLRAQR